MYLGEERGVINWTISAKLHLNFCCLKKKTFGAGQLFDTKNSLKANLVILDYILEYSSDFKL